jgi:hypothetical protein
MTQTTTKTKTIETLPSNPFVFEVLELVSKQRSNTKKIEVLKTYEHDSIKSILIWNFDETVISLLPEGDVPYSDLKDQNVYSGNLSENLIREANGGEAATRQDFNSDGKTSLRKEYQNLYNFVKGGNNTLSTIRRETMFINILRGLHPKEAEILCLVKDKKLSNKYKITKELVSHSYPDIVWGNRS